MKKIFNAIFICLSLLFLTPKTYAAPPTLDQVVDNIQKQYEKTEDLEADFAQEAFNKTLQKTQKAQGKLYMKKPGLMHWDYLSPEKQVIILDKNYFWWYTPATRQVVQQLADEAIDSNLAVTFMGGMGKMSKDFKISFANPPKEGEDFDLKLVPAKAQVNITHLILTVDDKNYQTQKISLSDFYGNVTTIRFTNLKINQKLKKSLFEFTPPPGVQVVTPKDFPGGKR